MKIYIFSGPAGSGKTTAARILIDQYLTPEQYTSYVKRIYKGRMPAPHQVMRPIVIDPVEDVNETIATIRNMEGIGAFESVVLVTNRDDMQKQIADAFPEVQVTEMKFQKISVTDGIYMEGPYHNTSDVYPWGNEAR